MTPVLELDGLSKDWGDGVGLKPTDLAVGPGELLALIGPNGAGKSTLVAMCVGLVRPTAGAVTVVGEPVGSIEAREALSYVPDHPVLYDDLGLWEHLKYVALLHETDQWETQAMALVGAFGLDGRVADLPTRFSRGMKQKTALALALIRPFEILVADEPLSGLDISSRRIAFDLIGAAVQDGAAAMVVTHDPELISRCDRVVGLQDGEKVLDGRCRMDEVRRLLDP